MLSDRDGWIIPPLDSPGKDTLSDWRRGKALNDGSGGGGFFEGGGTSRMLGVAMDLNSKNLPDAENSTQSFR
jgi:hypothetical protein